MKQVMGWVFVAVVIAACVGFVVMGSSRRRETQRADSSTTATTPAPQRVQERGIDPAAARMAQLLAVAREQASRWQRDARLVTVRVAPEPNGLINLTKAAPGADFLFWSDAVNDCLGVMFREGGEIRPYPHAEPLERKEIPAAVLGIEEALVQARGDRWNQKVDRAVLAWRAKKGYPGRFGWTVVGDRSVPDDRVYCIDAATGKPFLAIEIEEFLETPAGGDTRWLPGALARAMPIGEMGAVWQVVDVEIQGIKVTVPVRPLNDREREKVLGGAPQGVQAGPVAPMTAEQKRIFRRYFKGRAIDVGVEPGMVLSDAPDHDAVKRAVEAKYARRGNPSASR